VEQPRHAVDLDEGSVRLDRLDDANGHLPALDVEHRIFHHRPLVRHHQFRVLLVGFENL
jgi:hypothetical protein